MEKMAYMEKIEIKIEQLGGLFTVKIEEVGYKYHVSNKKGSLDKEGTLKFIEDELIKRLEK